MTQTNSKAPMARVEKLLSKRERLHAKWRTQNASLDDDRNLTAGEIYTNTQNLEQACADLCRAEYAASWTQRWELKR